MTAPWRISRSTSQWAVWQWQPIVVQYVCITTNQHNKLRWSESLFSSIQSNSLHLFYHLLSAESSQPYNLRPCSHNILLSARTSISNKCYFITRSGNDIHHIGENMLHRAWLVLGLVTTFGGSTILVFIQDTQAHSVWPTLCGEVQWVPEIISAIPAKKRHLRSYDLMALYQSVYYKYK